MESHKNDNSNNNNNEQQGLQDDNEEEVQGNNNDNGNDKVISVDDIEEKEKAYKAEIEQLNAEIELERLNNAKLQSELNIEEQIQVLRKELTTKTTKLQQLQNTNTKQKDAIEQLSLQIKKHSDKALQHKKTKLNNNNETNNSIDIILKSKDKELNNLLSLVNVLAKDNKEMKRAIDMNGEYKMKVELNDKNKLKETKLHKLNEDIKHMKLLLEEHKQCVNDKNNYITQLQAIQNDITSTRTKHAELRNELLLTEEQNKAIIKPYLLNAKSKAKSNVNEEEQEQIKDKQDISRDKQIKYKIITDNVRMYLINKSNYYEDTEHHQQQQQDQQERLVLNKIEEFEKMQSVLEKKNKIEIRTYELKVNELQDQIINVNKELKEKESKNKIMKCEINEIKNDIKKYQGLLQSEHYKCEELGQELNNKIKETNQWKEQLNSLRRLVQQTMDDPLESEEYKEYINKVREDVKKAEEELNEEKDNKEEQNENENEDGNEEEDNGEQNEEEEDDDENDNEEQNENEEKVMEDKNV